MYSFSGMEEYLVTFYKRKFGDNKCKKINLGLMGKFYWKVPTKEDFPWVKIVNSKYLSNYSFLDVESPRGGSTFLNGL